MRIVYSIIVLLMVYLSGCRNETWYTVRGRNSTEQIMYDCYMKGWREGVAGQGVTPGLTTPVPDEITITWKTIKPGKEEVLKQYEEEIERAADEWTKATEDYTKHVPYPSIKEPEGIFEDHKVVLVMKGKFPSDRSMAKSLSRT